MDKVGGGGGWIESTEITREINDAMEVCLTTFFIKQVSSLPMRALKNQNRFHFRQVNSQLKIIINLTTDSVLRKSNNWKT
jgi:hypothetical protein